MKNILLSMLLLTGLNANLTQMTSIKEKIPIKQKNSKQIEEFRNSCDKGDIRGCYNLGFFYNTAKGTKKDYAKARKYYMISCNAGYARACTRLGLLYGEGKGVDKDIKRAKVLFKKACKGGHQDGCMVYNVLNK